MALATLLPKPNRLTVTTLVMTPIPGPSTAARIECTRCPAVMVVQGFPLQLVRRLMDVAQQDHTCSATR